MNFDKKIPVVSVIIPMYNAEKYIEHCLQTIKAQTFKDFELIVVDDGSTDRSVEIVEAFIKNWAGASARLVRLPENSGVASVPRNVGLKLARGFYVTFIDADDMIKPAALEILVNQTLTVATDNLAERIERFCKRGYLWNACSKLFRRDFLIENRIEFVNARTAEDMIFVFNCVCLAARYVRIPEAFYVYRQHDESITHAKLSLDRQVKRYVPSLVRGVKAFDDFLGKHRFFIEHPRYKMMMMQFLFEVHMLGEIDICKKFPAHKIKPLIRAELAKESLDDAAVVMSYLLNAAAEFRLRLLQIQNKSQAGK